MKEITIDGIEYVLLKKEKATLEPVEEDKYKKIREVVIRIQDILYIQGDKKELGTYEDGTVELSSKYDWKSVEDVLHFEECTLGDLQENDVFFCKGFGKIITSNLVNVVARIEEKMTCYTLNNDIIMGHIYNINQTKVIKILRD